MNEFLTARQLAMRLQVSPDTVRGWARAGKIPEIRLSAKVRRFDLEQVLKAVRPRPEVSHVGG